jgi:ribosomal protein S18 acetylase RimI-like enzyme
METRPFTDADVLAAIDQFAAVYRAAFSGPPYNRQEFEVTEFSRSLPMHTGREGFRCIAASSAPGIPLVGFAYGYRSKAGQWWYDNVSRAMSGHARQLWLADAFQVTEIAVMPGHQRQGIGGNLLDVLLSDVPNSRAVLSTLDAETAGRAMYLNRGWQNLLEGFYFPGVPRRYAIMGRVLREESL